MTRSAVAAAVLAAACSAAVWSQDRAVPELAFEVSEPLVLPEDLYFGEVVGVALNSKRHVFVYTRTGGFGGSILSGERAQLFEFGADGRFIREVGRNLYSKAWAHSVRIDRDDNIWLVDNGSDLVVKLGPDQRLLLTLGRRDEAVLERLRRPPIPADAPISLARPGYFFEPTDVAFDRDGNIFVSDGYINSNVHKFDRDGHIVKMVGDRKAAGPGQFNQPHAIAVDDRGHVYVADRSNHRVQVLDNDLNYVREIRYEPPMPRNYRPPIPAFGSHYNFHTHGPWFSDGTLPAGGTPDDQWESLWPNTLCITPGPEQYLFVQDMFPGQVQKFTLDGTLLGRFGSAGRRPGQFGWLHSLACVSEHEIWTGELLNWRVQRFRLKPGEGGGQ
ncbi:MAG: 6-bladed beta-propeller [Acidimicrobiia bacterium]|nr:6-bladed beta-propeller [Acidimicrobiia bacterium]